MSDLIRLLQGLGDAAHDDLEVAYDAIAEIVRLREELSAATAELEQARETNKRLEAQLAENDAKALALRVALEKANVELD